MTSTKVTAAQATPASVEKINILSSKTPGKSVSVVNGLIELRYYESILQDSVMATVNFVDSGNTIEDEKGVVKSALEGLPIVGSERVELSMTDLNENKIEYNKKFCLYFKCSTKKIFYHTSAMVYNWIVW